MAITVASCVCLRILSSDIPKAGKRVVGGGGRSAYRFWIPCHSADTGRLCALNDFHCLEAMTSQSGNGVMARRKITRSKEHSEIFRLDFNETKSKSQTRSAKTSANRRASKEVAEREKENDVSDGDIALHFSSSMPQLCRYLAVPAPSPPTIRCCHPRLLHRLYPRYL